MASAWSRSRSSSSFELDFSLSLIDTCCLPLTLGRIRSPRQIAQKFEKRWRLADEQPVPGKRSGRPHCSSLSLSRANDRTYRELSAEEWTWLGHNQVGLACLPP